MSSEPSDFNDLAAKPGGKRRVADQIGSVASAEKAVATFAPFEIRAGGVYWTPTAKKDDEPQAIFFCSCISFSFSFSYVSFRFCCCYLRFSSIF